MLKITLLPVVAVMTNISYVVGQVIKNGLPFSEMDIGKTQVFYNTLQCVFA